MHTIVYASCAETPTIEDRAFLIIPAGEFRANDGRPRDASTWRMDRATAERVIHEVSARRRPVLVDYEHQTLETAKNGLPAPAAGWINRLEWREGQGLFALETEWTPKAKAFLRSREYRYISPVLSYAKYTGEVLDLLHVALTNTPALSEIPAIPLLAAAKSQAAPMASAKEQITDQDLTICRMMGIDPTDFANARDDETRNQSALAQQHGLSSTEMTICDQLGIEPADYLREARGSSN